ncbi:unnamed protein product, partial [Allacma fusca]
AFSALQLSSSQHPSKGVTTFTIENILRYQPEPRTSLGVPETPTHIDFRERQRQLLESSPSSTIFSNPPAPCHPSLAPWFQQHQTSAFLPPIPYSFLPLIPLNLLNPDQISNLFSPGKDKSEGFNVPQQPQDPSPACSFPEDIPPLVRSQFNSPKTSKHGIRNTSLPCSPQCKVRTIEVIDISGDVEPAPSPVENRVLNHQIFPINLGPDLMEVDVNDENLDGVADSLFKDTDVEMVLDLSINNETISSIAAEALCDKDTTYYSGGTSEVLKDLGNDMISDPSAASDQVPPRRLQTARRGRRWGLLGRRDPEMPWLLKASDQIRLRSSTMPILEPQVIMSNDVQLDPHETNYNNKFKLAENVITTRILRSVSQKQFQENM